MVGPRAVAVEAAVRGADLAAAFEKIPQSASGAMVLHRERVRIGTPFCGQVAGPLAAEVDPPDEFGVALGKIGKQTFETAAQHPFLFRVSRSAELITEAVERTVPRVVSPVQVDDRPTENPVEPRNNRLLGRLALGGDSLQQAILHRVPRQVRIAESGPGESGEGIKVRQKRLGNLRHGGKRRSGQRFKSEV